MNDSKSDNEKVLLLSYDTVRRTIGFLGLSLPLVLFLDSTFICHEPVLQSISHYYYSNFGDVFVGILVFLASFLIFYRGYEKSFDNVFSVLSAIGALGVAFSPCKGSSFMKGLKSCNETFSDKFLTNLHFGSALFFFGSATILTMFYFTKSNSRSRNIIYYVCGSVMILSNIWIVFTIDEKPIFIPESIALIAFGIAWLTKGKIV